MQSTQASRRSEKFSAESLIAAVGKSAEDSLWNSVRALEESGLMLQHVSAHLLRQRNFKAAETLAHTGARSTSAIGDGASDRDRARRNRAEARAGLTPGHQSSCSQPWSTANRTTSMRLRSPSFCDALVLCVSIVLTLSPSWAAISLLL